MKNKIGDSLENDNHVNAAVFLNKKKHLEKTLASGQHCLKPAMLSFGL